jgi:uncharacterized protein involved in exopolysaccharide biosynthesis/Mrp family chromosome partitioning ATPase
VESRIITHDGVNRLRRTSQPSQREFPDWLQPSAGSRQAYAGLGDFVRILRRRRGLILLTVGTVVLLTFLAVARMTPTYSSTAVVMIEPLDAPPGTVVTPTVASPSEELRIATKLELLASRTLARRVAKSLKLEENKEFAPPERTQPGLFERVLGLFAPKREESALQLDEGDKVEAEQRARQEKVTDRLMEHILVERLAKSHLISVTASSTDPFMAALMANRLAETHIKSQLNAERDADNQSIDQLRDRVGQLRRQVQANDAAVAAYRRDHGLFVEKPEELDQIQITRLAGSLAEARAERASSAVRASGGNAIISSPVLNDLRGQEATLRKRLAELTAFYGRGYPEVAATRAQLDELSGRIAIEAARAARNLSNEAAADSAKAGQLASEIGGAQARGIRNGFADVGLRDLERDAQTSNALYLSLLARLKEISGKGQSQHADTSIVSRAPVPDNPSYPRPKRALGVALIGSLILALILALVAETLDDRLRTSEQVRRVLGLPTLAMVPQLPLAMTGRTPREIVHEYPRSFFSEALRNLVIEIETRRTHPGAQVIVVTSPLPDEGKSTVANGLAAAASAIGRSAVVVDLDMRKQEGLRSVSETEAEPDVVAFLTQGAALDQVLSAGSEAEPFAAISVRQAVFDPGGMLESPRLRVLFSELRHRFDLVVVNAPPILPVHDAKTLSRLADGTLLVLRWGHTDPDAARTAMEAFGDGIIGAVVNRVDYTKHARRHYGDAIEHSQRYGGDYNREGYEVIAPAPLLARLRGATQA